MRVRRRPIERERRCHHGAFGGSSCSQCHGLYAGDATLALGLACTKRCPGAVGMLPCSGHGVCSEGVCMSCHGGYAGAGCEIPCPATSGVTCSSHGVCRRSDGVCDCVYNATHGYFIGAACATCDSLFSGPSCTLPCPVTTAGMVCGNIGSCMNGVCICPSGRCGTNCETSGEACNTCPLGLYGSSCDRSCAGGSSNPCSGHGICNGGRFGDGSCVCASGYAGTACSLVCPGGAVTPCAGHGTCSALSGVCACTAFYATPDCSVRCPGLAADGLSACTGHGSCSQGADGSGYCLCDPGYTGAACDAICPGGIVAPCSLHGVCESDATCSCSSTDATGYWSGAICATCAVGFTGASCRELCPRDAAGLVCSDHGACMPGPTCKCAADAITGHWTGLLCDECVPGYYGAQCTSECPGSACQPCGGHGRCSDGVSGTGKCTCVADPVNGTWAGAGCEDCADSYWGTLCTSPCPGNSSRCGGFGTCSSGVTGTGQCICQPMRSVGADGLCSECAANAFGPMCLLCGVDALIQAWKANSSAVSPTALAARNYTAADYLPCRGNGTCSDGKAGSGECACSAGYGGARCQYACPVDSATGLTCGRGTCGASGCACTSQWALDNSTATCRLCAPGYYGNACANACPTCESGSRCNDGRGGDGTCVCSFGYWGAACNRPCPGGVSAPCSGHGTCRASDGACLCYADDARGYYTGSACGSCVGQYASPFCNVSCPSINGAICNDRGVCYDGACSQCTPTAYDTSSKICGALCHLSGLQCYNFSNVCPAGFWGFGCAAVCAGTTRDASVICSGHGTCNPDDGACLCDNGFGGIACDSQCPMATINGRELICGGRGSCVNSTCNCLHGNYGTDCTGICPGGQATPCSGNGRCNGTTGVCTCVRGMTGASCATECRGGRNDPCSSHGVCQPADGACTCYSSPSLGYFTGSACSACMQAYGGGDCRTLCNPMHGRTEGLKCRCESGHAGAGCNIACPTGGVDDLPCSGHGTCNDGAEGDGTCRCDGGWYGRDCSVACDATICSTIGLVHSQCEPTNGTCQCQLNAEGRFTSTTCDECVAGFWGAQCTLACACNGRGSCERSSGECSCFQSVEEGYWGGQYCTVCATGYIGLLCKSKNIQFSENANDTAVLAIAVPDTATPGTAISFTDANYNQRYRGANPVLISLLDAPKTVVGSVLFAGGAGGPLAIVVHNATHLKAFGSLGHTALLPRGATGSLELAWNASSSTPQALTQKRRLLQAVTNGTESDLTAEAIDALTNTRIVGYANGTVFVMSLDGSRRYVTLTGTLSSVATIIVEAASPGYATVTGGDAVSTPAVPYGSWAVMVLDLSLLGAANATTAGAVWVGRAATVHTQEEVQWAAATTSDATADLVCSKYAPCVATSCVYARARREAACVLRRNGASSFAIFPIPADFTTPGAQRMTAAKFIETRVPVEVTAVAVDTVMGLYVVAFNEADNPSQLFKFRASDAVVTGQLLLLRRGVENEVVRGLDIDMALRTVVATIVTGYSVEARSINLFGIRSITPSIFDARGGTLLTISGEGFLPFNTPLCQVAADVTVPATYIDNETVTCVAPASSSTGAACTSLLFNVAFGNRSTDATNIGYQRPASAVLQRAISAVTGRAYVREGDTTSVVLRGTGFVNSPWATCAIVSGALLRPHWTLGTSTFINSTSVRCTVSGAVPKTELPAFIIYSHDAHIFGTSTTPFAVVGTSSGLAVASPPQMTVVVASSVVLVPAVIVDVVDAFGNALYQFDTAKRTFGAQMQQRADGSAPPQWANGTVQFATTVAGEAVFRLLLIERPAEGLLDVIFTESSSRWSTVLSLSVVVGRPALLVLDATNGTNQAGVWRFGYAGNAKLRPPPILFVTDIAGNRIVAEADLPAALRLVYSTVATDTSDVPSPTELTASLSGGHYEFLDVAVRGLHDVANQLRFSAVNTPTIEALVVDKIATEKCAQSEYAVSGTTACRPCPDHGVCDGTSNVQVEAGYWRSSRSSVAFLSCSPPYSADSCDRGTCKAGYEGPRCSVCTDGYGKTDLACQECPNAAVSYLLIALVALFLLAVLFSFVIKSITAGAESLPGQKKDVLPIVFKMLLNHFQVTAIVGLSNVNIPTVLGDFFRGQQTASSINPNISFMACEVTPTYASKFMLVAISPFVIIIFFAVIHIVPIVRAKIAIRRGGTIDLLGDNAIYEAEVEQNKRALFGELYAPNYNLNGSASFRRENSGRGSNGDGAAATSGSAVLPYFEEEEPFDAIAELALDESVNRAVRPPPIETLAQRSMRKGVFLQWLDLVAVTLLVVLHMVYPTILELSGNLLLCETIDYGEEPSRSVLAADRSIDCESSSYATLRNWAFAHLFVYGIGFPLFNIALTKVMAAVSMGGDLDDAKRLFFFVTGGYAGKRWYWESVVLARKAAVVAVAFAISDARLRVYGGMWTMAFAFALNAIVQPYDDVLLYRLETSSLMAISLSLNLSLLFNYYSAEENPGVFYTVLVGIFIINGAVLLGFVYGLVVASKSKLLTLAAKHPLALGFVKRMFEDSVEVLETKETTTREKVDALRAALRTTLPRMVVVTDAAARPESIRHAPEADAAMVNYTAFVQSGAVRLQRLPNPVDQVREWYELEKQVLVAELDVLKLQKMIRTELKGQFEVN
jgi:hypothetical protein